MIVKLKRFRDPVQGWRETETGPPDEWIRAHYQIEVDSSEYTIFASP